MSEPLDRLVQHAHETRVIVIGGGVSGLVAARECAKVGLRVTVLEAADVLGGVVRSAEVGGMTLDVGAESFATRGGVVRDLLDELGLGADVVSPNPAGAWVAGVPGVGAAPLPKGGVLGIPDNPFAPDVRRVIGWSGAWRAYVDRVRPPLTIGHAHSLGKLVRSRLGARVLDRLVAPVTSGVYSARPDDIDVDLAAPGLNAALTRTGSLTGAVAELRARRPQTRPADAPASDVPVVPGAAKAPAPGGAVQGIVGGMSRLVDALVAGLRDADVEVRTGVRAGELSRVDGEWAVSTSADDEPLRTHAVIVALPEGPARQLLAPVVPGLDLGDPIAPVVEVVTLVLEAPVLDSAPRGTGVLTVPGSHVAKALTHSSAKWDWVRDAAEPGVHVVRVSFGAQGEEPATAALDDAAAADLARSEAALLLGVELPASALRAAHRVRYVQSQPAATIGRAAVTQAARGAIRAVSGLGATGAWLSGTGLAQVIPDARDEADRLRSAALWQS
ncbi:oxygen-dependent protoporphyrinogen oxidase [Microbacterium sp. ru370.1]|uniref:protoporphyrinogen oxidase n=1 Tax=unclassified Microbacterium TaxID=2609290 RepID=UPI0008918118|nr:MULTISPECIES: protoporphyrinogen oxidase [unclassified Microbacterium]SDO29699.1 oxygen-dependent protoporphyrinogen oxidase [Microbacterium sp. ru370.1]SIT75703.1 oxygen-dependent protoporphyrinogen oxidase [Microbacterium sp. RU1D]